MRKRLAVVLCGVAGFGMVIAGIVGVEPSDATPLPSACIFVSADVENLVTTTVAVDTDGTTCPAPPPTQTMPCEDGFFQRQNPTVPGVADVFVFVCVKGV